MRALAWTLSTLLIACGGSDDPGGVGGASGATASGGSGGVAGSAGSAGAGGGAAGQAGCATELTPPGTDPTCLASVSGRLVDDDGGPIGGVVASVCGPVCFYGETGADGRFTVDVNAVLTPADYSVLAHARPLRASFYFRLPALTADGTVDVGDLPVLALPDGPPLALDGTAQTVTSGEVTLSVPDGVTVKLDPEDLAGGDDGKKLRVLRLDRSRYATFGIDDAYFAVYAFAPFEAWFRAADKSETTARVSFAPGGDLTPGAAIEVAALGSYLFPEWIAPAQLGPAASAAVAADGRTVELDAGQGLPYLTWVALRAKP